MCVNLIMFYLSIRQKVDRFNSTNQLIYEDVPEDDKSDADEIWRKIYIQSDTESQDPLLESLHATFQKERRWAMLLHFVYYQSTMCVPLFSYYIFESIVANTFNTPSNIALVVCVIIIKLSKPFLRVFAQDRLRWIGQKMQSILSRAVLAKAFKVSLLSNHDVTSSELMKIMQVDIERIVNYPQTKSYLMSNFYCLLFNMLMLIFLFGWAGLVGIAVLVVSLSVRVGFKAAINVYEEELGAQTGKRVQKTVDIFNIIKFIKVTALEIPYFEKLVGLRENELNILHRKNKFEITPVFIMICSVRLVALVTCWMQIANGNEFSSAVVFTLNIIFININFYYMVIGITTINEAKQSLKIIDNFLKTEEMSLSHIARGNSSAKEAIVVKNGNFFWELKSDVSEAQPQRIRLKDVNLTIAKGSFVSVIGKYGSGKTSLFYALLGEMRDGGGSAVALNGTVAYVSQKAWIVSDTVRGNILFGAPFDANRYANAVHFACLKADLQSLSAGDQTLIGERGCTLSGGQRARVSLARALYAEADVLLLDDILSAVDAHVGAFLFFETLAKHLRGRTVLLITHSLSFVQHTDRILVLDSLSIIADGTFQQLKHHPILQQVTTAQKKEKNNKTDVALIQDEIQYEVDAVGQLATDEQAIRLFFSRSGGLKFSILTIVFILMTAASYIILGLWLNKWGNATDYQQSRYFWICLLLVLLFTTTTMVLFFYIHHSPILINVYKDMIKGVLFASLSYFDTTPIAKIIHRLSNDLGMLDKIVLVQYFAFSTHVANAISYAASIFFVCIMTKRYILLTIFVLSFAYTIYEYWRYVKALKSYRHAENELKIPINSYFSEVVQGQETIRAFGRTQQRQDKFQSYNDEYSHIKRIVNRIDVLINFQLSMFSTLYLLILMISYFQVKEFSKYDVFLLVNIISMEEYLQRINQNVTEFLVKLKCLSKCQQLASIPTEDGYRGLVSEWGDDNEEQMAERVASLRALSPFAKGEIEFRDVRLSYRREAGDVLRGVSFKVRAGEKVGVVGRTGSGKSTLFLALLRIIEQRSGFILVDGVDTRRLSLAALRANVNFILQEHFLFAGSVRTNVDPSEEHTDEEVEHALALCGVWEGLSKREGLRTSVAEGGENLSVGERQLLNIARSLLSRRRIVLIDEATASIDAQSDARIQSVLSTHFADCTVLTIAHRLQTVGRCDRVLVLEKGEVFEFDAPATLMQQQHSLYKQLCAETKGEKQE